MKSMTEYGPGANKQAVSKLILIWSPNLKKRTYTQTHCAICWWWFPVCAYVSMHKCEHIIVLLEIIRINDAPAPLWSHFAAPILIVNVCASLKLEQIKGIFVIHSSNKRPYKMFYELPQIVTLIQLNENRRCSYESHTDRNFTEQSEYASNCCSHSAHTHALTFRRHSFVSIQC